MSDDNDDAAIELPLRYLIYAIATGRIVSVLYVLPSNLQVNVQEGQSAFQISEALEVSSETHYFGPGGLYTFPPQPGPHFVWDWATHGWLDSTPLDELKAAKWEEIKAAREEAIADPLLVTDFGVLDVDGTAIANLRATYLGCLAAEEADAPVASVPWTMHDNTVVDLTAAQLGQAVRLLMQRRNATHAIARELRARIDAATSATDLTLIRWLA